MEAGRLRCSKCQHEFAAPDWKGFELVAQLSEELLRTLLVSDWPADTVVEIRQCPACGADIARKVAGGGNLR